MKKCVYLILTILIMQFLSINIFATENNFYEDNIGRISDFLDDSTVKMLNDIGLDEFTYDELYNLSFSDITDLISSLFTDKLKTPFRCILMIVSISLICMASKTYINRKNDISMYTEKVSMIFVSLLVMNEIAGCLTRTVSSIMSLGVLMKTLVPVLAAIVTFNGNAALALSYNAVTLYAAQIITFICRDFLTPLLVIFVCVAICLSFNSLIKSDSVLSTAKKCINTVLGFSGTVFTGFISVKDILATGADRVSVKGIKFLLGSSVPVVGSALSEGFSSILASVGLMKNTVGIIGIIIIIIIVLPVICELIIWIATLSAGNYFCEIMDQHNISSVLMSFKFSFSMLLSIVLFTAYILIVSSGMLIIMGNK